MQMFKTETTHFNINFDLTYMLQQKHPSFPVLMKVQRKLYAYIIKTG